MHTRTHPEIR